MTPDLLSEMKGVDGGNGLVQLVLRHPIDAHGVARVGDSAVAATSHLNVRGILIQLSVVALALVVSEHQRMRSVLRCSQLDVGLEQTVPDHSQLGKHRPAEHDRIEKRSSFDILDDVGQVRLLEHRPDGFDQTGPFASVAVALG